MPDDRISLRQLLALLFAALLAPAIGVLPSQTAALAGEAGWLSALAALPVLLGLCWVLFALLRPAGEGAGLAQVTETVLGRGLGKGVLLLYLLWGLLLLSANARLFALRFLSTSYRNAPLGLFLLTLLGLTLWLVRKPVRVLARTGEVFYLALAIGLGFSLILGVLQVEPGTSFPCGRRIFRGCSPPPFRCWACSVMWSLPPSWGGMSPGERETAAVRYGGRPPSVWCLPPFSLSAWATSGPG